ncbi:MAG: hypothetical protein IJK67_03280 [Bacilli bacterium]|nr:hypothetical protein [Bacilli bacterium]
MNKKLIIFIIILLIIVVIKYTFSNYELNYNVDGYNIISKLDNGVLYFEIQKDVKYNFDIYTKSRKKIFIKSIKELEVKDYKCILPIIENIDTYPICYSEKENVNVDYNLINSNALLDYKKESIPEKKEKDFYFNNNLDENIYIALWTYKGYILMNNKEYKLISIFDNDRYDNDLAHQIKNTIYMPNYDVKHEYDELVALDMVSQKVSKIKLNKKIDYDSYVVGNIKNMLYIYDNKKSILYEINVKNGETEIISSSEKGYKKYSNGKFIECSKSEYKNDKITIDNEFKSNYNYEIEDRTYKVYKNNLNIKTKISENKINIVAENNSDLYYKFEDSFYKYNPKNGSERIFYDYELSFNNSKSVFMFIK